MSPRFEGTIGRISIGFTSRNPFPLVGQDSEQDVVEFESLASVPIAAIGR